MQGLDSNSQYKAWILIRNAVCTRQPQNCQVELVGSVRQCSVYYIKFNTEYRTVIVILYCYHPERVFFQTYITNQDISRIGTDYETGRPSEPVFQDMNFGCTRCSNYKGRGPGAVVYQTCNQNALYSQSLVIAYSYEENDTVTPVASDFDCFTVGTRGVVYDEPLPS